MIFLVIAIYVTSVALFGWPSLFRITLWSALAALPAYQSLSRWRTELVIGDLGFRYVRPLHRDRGAPWSVVTSVEAEGMGRYKAIVISFSESGRPVEIPVNGLRARLKDVCVSAQERWHAHETPTQNP